jgi:plastocyanin
VLRSRLAFVTVASLSLVLAVAGTVSASKAQRHVNMLDDCDAVSFNAAVGDGTCSKAGGTTFEEFIGQLLASGQAPAWRFAPDAISLPAGGTIVAPNRGGEFHTFTEVANFGGGCVQPLNDVLGLTPVPECANAGVLFATTGAGPGGEVETPALAPGVHRFECLIHPWMRATVTVD